MMFRLACAACTIALVLVGCDESREWKVPEVWKPVRFKGADREFIFIANNNDGGLATNGIPELMARYPSFADMVPSIRCSPLRRKDGTFSYALVDNPDIPTDRAFFVDVVPRVSCYPHDFYFANVRHDKAAYAKWLDEHPLFLGFRMGEWFNDLTLPRNDKGRWLVDFKPKSQALSEEENASVLARPEYAHATGDRDVVTTNLAVRHIHRLFELHFGDAKHSSLEEGVACTSHLAAYEGAGSIGIETTRNYTFYQIQEMFCRGAARQFALPWTWYLASYFGGYDSTGKFCWSGSRFACDHPKWKMHGPKFGISLSAIERTMYLTWLSGAASYERETMEWTHFQRDKTPLELSDEGRLYDQFWHIATSNERGVPYTPFAILAPRNRGELRTVGRPYGWYFQCPYTQSDFMLDAILSTVLEFPKNLTRTAYTGGVERVMANSRYGDLFDVLTPDFPDQTTFRRTVGAYPCAILTGSYGENPEMEEILRDYVENGGTLILNVRQLTKGFPAAFTGLEVAGEKRVGERTFALFSCSTAHPVLTGDDGLVRFAVNQVGKGRVVVAAEHWLTPWGADEKKAAEQAHYSISEYTPKPARFTDIEWLLDTLSERFAPVKVAGDIQWGINRTKDGWLLYLINNGGVTKFGDTPAVLSPTPVRISVDLSRIGPVKGIREIISGRTAVQSGAAFMADIPSGGVQIFEIKTKERK